MVLWHKRLRHEAECRLYLELTPMPFSKVSGRLEPNAGESDRILLRPICLRLRSSQGRYLAPGANHGPENIQQVVSR